MRYLFLIFTLLLAPGLLWAAPEPPWNKYFDCSGTITATSTPQVLTGLPLPMHGYQIQNLSAGTLGFSEMTTTPSIGTAGTWQLSASGGSYTTPSTYAPAGSIYITGATAGQAFTCMAW